MTFNKYIAAAGLAAMLFAAQSCDKDGDTIYTDGPDRAEVSGVASDIVLDKNHLQALALTLYWNENGKISLSDPRVAAPDGAAHNTVQFSADPEFASVVDDNVETGVYYRQYTCETLNNLVGRLGLEGGVKGTVYIRVKTVLGANIDPKYSDVQVVSITPYFIDMSLGFVLDASQNDTGRTLYSLASDGIYSGFIGAGSWENWWLREGNNTVWGNDGVTGTAFVMGNNTTGLDVWNFWYPSPSGCYYTVVNTRTNEWSALYIGEMNLGGDISGAMTYDRKANKWTYTFDAAAGTINVTLSANGKQYNTATGTDDAAAVDTPVAFGGEAGKLTFGQAAQAIAVDVAAAGETTLTLDLSDPRAWTLTAGAGSAGPVETVPPVIYLSGVQPDWDFSNYLKLYNEDNRTYGGALQVNSEWGYRIYTEAEAWDNYWTMVDGGTAFSGQLVNNGEGNIAAPEAGFYLFDVNMGDLTYKLTPVTKVSYTGLNDDWSLTEMTATGEPGVYTAQFEKTANTPWGVKIVLNDNWDLFFGGNGTRGELVLYRDGFEGDNELSNGTHTLTVNLSKGTYSYE
ncbi:MAG: DUF5114 domain-containing protein [Muribaculaceae bacterium]|nr:DUF5114 domain-containing protein [Muribaculaceae bacterium]